ncbi:MAG: FHA domain-containing protein [Gammaproteobacteria bacterium]
MARLILSLDGQVLAEYNMTKERYTIGRLPDNDIRIDNPAVSGHHSLVINILNDSFLEDLNSTNGTYVNGKLIKKHALQHGDVITVGHHQLRFVDDQVNDVEQDEFEKTMVIEPSSRSVEEIREVERAVELAREAEQEEIAAKAKPVETAPKPEPKAEPKPAPAPEPIMGEATTAVADPPDVRPTSTTVLDAPVQRVEADAEKVSYAKLQVLSGPFAGRELELKKALTTLGRPGVQVAAITRRSEGYYMVQVDGGTDGSFPYLNGEPIGPKAAMLNHEDVIELAGVKMGFFAN